jgi:uroporphyrinogen-III synthase
MKLLIIRPQPGNDASAARARAIGFEVVQLPFFEVRPRIWAVTAPEDYDALLLTSSNAVRHAGAGLQQLRHLPVHAVGERTASEALSKGLNIASIGKSDATEAVNAAVDAGHRRLLWLAGQDHRAIEPPEGAHIDTVICYASEALSLPADSKTQILAADAIALHSARAAKLFSATVKQLGIDPSTIIIAAFSPAIAEAAGAGWRAAIVADMANDSALLSALQSLGRQGPDKAARKEVT